MLHGQEGVEIRPAGGGGTQVQFGLFDFALMAQSAGRPIRGLRPQLGTGGSVES